MSCEVHSCVCWGDAGRHVQIIVVQWEDSLDTAGKKQLALVMQSARNYVHDKEVDTSTLILLRRLAFTGKSEVWLEISSPRDLHAVVERVKEIQLHAVV